MHAIKTYPAFHKTVCFQCDTDTLKSIQSVERYVSDSKNNQDFYKGQCTECGLWTWFYIEPAQDLQQYIIDPVVKHFRKGR